ncbi:hypothetical protein BDC45DRAFT_576978 [Circinella umbellata]|nr:hypothetical protein BDC45DRAFT_576978 [Circinella umbellata]
MTNKETESAWLASVDEWSDQQYIHYLQTFYNAQNALTTVSQQTTSQEDALETLCNAFKAVDSASYRKAWLESKKIEKKKNLKEDERWTEDCEDQTIPKDILHCSGKLGHNTSSQIIRSANAMAKAKKVLNDYNKASKELYPNFSDLDEARELNSYATQRYRKLLKAKETEERGVAYECLIERKLADAKKKIYKKNEFMFDENSEENMIAVEENPNDEEDDENEELREDTFMIDLSKILLHIYGEVHGEEGYAELQEELPAGQEFEL